MLKDGRVEIQKASVSQLPFSDNKFDLVTAVETQYYWPDLDKDMEEILRVLKPGGTLIVIAGRQAQLAEAACDEAVEITPRCR